MHVCHAIYRLGYDAYMALIANLVGYTTLKKDFNLKKWNKHDEFLLLFTEASFLWLQSMFWVNISKI